MPDKYAGYNPESEIHYIWSPTYHQWITEVRLNTSSTSLRELRIIVLKHLYILLILSYTYSLSLSPSPLFLSKLGIKRPLLLHIRQHRVWDDQRSQNAEHDLQSKISRTLKDTPAFTTCYHPTRLILVPLSGLSPSMLCGSGLSSP